MTTSARLPEAATTTESTQPPSLTPSPLPSRLRGQVWQVALIVLGLGAGFAIARTNNIAEDSTWRLWGVVGTALGGLSGFAFASGLARYRAVTALQRVARGAVLPHVLAFAAVAATSLPLAVTFVPDGIIWQGIAIPGLAIIGLLPAGAAVAAIRVNAVEGPTGTIGRQLDVLLELRQLLGRLTWLFAALVIGVTVLTATGVDVPAPLVIFTGTAATLVVAFAYLPAAAVLNRRCRAFVDEQFVLTDVDREHLVQAAVDRHNLEGLLGLHGFDIGGLRVGLAILSPLVTGTGITLLPGF